MEGRDNQLCLHQQISCRTIGYIIEKECSCSSHLLIFFRGQQNFVFSEPCTASEHNNTYQCSVEVSGLNRASKPRILFEQNDNWAQECNFVNRYLSHQATNQIFCTEYDAKNQNQLQFTNLIIYSLTLKFHGPLHISARNVNFIDLEVFVDALMEMPCYFSCHSCSFSQSHSSNLSLGIHISHCLCLSFYIQNGTLSNAVIHLSFLYFCNVDMMDIHLQFSDKFGDNEMSAVFVHQVNTTRSPNMNLPSSIIKVTNFLTLNNAELGYIFQINLGSVANSKSVVQFENCVSRQSSCFLSYFVLSEASYLLPSPVHQLHMINTEIADSTGLYSVVSVSNEINFGLHNIGPTAEITHSFLVVFILNCSLLNNTAEEGIFFFSCAGWECSINYMQLFFENTLLKGNTVTSFYSSVFYMAHVINTQVQISNCSFYQNTGAKGVILFSGDETSLSVTLFSTQFHENAANLFSDGAGALYSYGTSVSLTVSVVNCLFSENSVNHFGAGALSFSCVRGSLTIDITNTTFFRNQAEKAGAVFIRWTRSSTAIGLTDSVFFENSAPFVWGTGGINLEGFKSTDLIIVTNTKFHRNTGSHGAMRLYVNQGSSNIVVNNTNIFGNTGDKLGGVDYGGGLVMKIYRSSALVSVAASQFYRNKESAVLMNMGTRSSVRLNVDASQFSQNRGGAIFVETTARHLTSLTINVTNSQFTRNTKKTLVLLIKSSLFNVSLHKCLFSQNTGDKGAAIFASSTDTQNSVLHISFSRFLQNIATTSGAAVHSELSSTKMEIGLTIVCVETDIFDNIIEEDSFDRSGGAIVVAAFDAFSKASILIVSCRLQNNTSQNYGGALALYLYESTFVQIESSAFINNTAGGSRNSFGGACYIFLTKGVDAFRHTGTIQLNKCVFTSNIATEGGSLFQTSKHSLITKLNVENTTFVCCHISSSDFIFLKMISTFKNVRFYYNFQQSDFAVLGVNLRPDGSHLLDNVLYSCHLADIVIQLDSISPVVETDANMSVNQSDDWKNTLTIFCSKCTSNYLSIGNSTTHIALSSKISNHSSHISGPQHIVKTESSCHSCPFGGQCMNGVVKALSNFWGYREGNSFVFVSCPLQYCCNGIDVLCDSFDSCAPHRIGKLCGQCEKGFTESLMSTVCIPDQQCNDWWLWLVAFLLALGYLMWYMFKGYIIYCLKYILHRFCSYQKHYVWAAKHSHKEQDSETDENAFFDILIYFVNIKNLINVQIEFQESDEKTSIIQNIETKFLMYLDVDVQQTFHMEVCPFPGINATLKTLARPIFTVMVLFIWLLLFAMILLFVHILTCFQHGTLQFFRYILKWFKLKLVEGFVQTVKYSFSGFAGATFMLLTCVKVGNGSFWKFNAEIECYSILQKIVIFAAATHTIPLVFIPPVAGKLLQSGHVGYVQTMFACVVPLPFLLFWVGWFILPGKYRRNQLESFPYHEKETQIKQIEHQNTPHITEEAQVLLDTYQGAFRKQSSHWESVIEFRKLIFCSFYLVPNNIYRLVLCTFACIIALVHHRSVYPFKHINSNRAETLSLSLLCIACVTNSIKSVFPQLGLMVKSNTPTEQLLLLMNRLDSIFALVLLSYMLAAEVFQFVSKAISKKED